MLRAIRVAVICLLAFALPLQGAMAGMLACAVRHAAAPAVAVGQNATHAHGMAHARHGDASRQHHGDAQAHDATPDPGDDTATQTADAADSVSTGSCSLCASCCTAAALPATMQPLGMPPVGHARPEPAAFTVDGIVPRGLERPPRALFA